MGFSVGTITLPGNEHLTLVEVTYRLYVRDVWYYGASAYGAVEGERGGFFTGGMCGGRSFNLSDSWSIDTECFFGGGGGGSAPQGGGMMVRPSCMFFKKAGRVSIGGGLAYVWFPNGEISSTSLCLGIRTDFKRSYIPGRKPVAGETDLDLEPVQWRYYATVSGYQPSEESRTTSKERYGNNIACMGFGADYFITERFFFTGRMYGAFSGGIDGYAKVICGPAFTSQRFANGRMRAEGSLLAGAAGGGGVDTGGGFLIQPEIGLTVDISDKYSLFLREGYLHAFAGNFNSFVTSFGVCYSFTGYTFSDTEREHVSYKSVPWRMGGMIKSYFSSDLRDKSDRVHDKTLSLIGVTADRMLGSNSYVCAKAYGAFEGNVGGYAEGLLGLGLILFQKERMSFESELCIGVSGGGGVDTGSGIIMEACVGFEYRFNESYACTLRAGWVSAPGGTFEVPFAQAGMTRSFGQIGEP